MNAGGGDDEKRFVIPAAEADVRGPAFQAVIARTRPPTDAEWIVELQFAVDLFRPSFDEEQGQDMASNCRRFWPLIFGRENDPRAEIVASLVIRKAVYGEPTRDYKQELRDALMSSV